MRPSESGFTLIEVMVAGAVAALVLLCISALVPHVAGAAASLNARLRGQSAAEHVIDRITAEAATAWAVYVPPNDVLGDANTDGHELDFFSEDGAHRTYAWAYRYDGNAKVLTRYAFAAGAAPLAGESLGGFDAFHARTVAASAVSTPGSALYDPLFAQAAPPDVTHEFAAMPGALGGNALTRVSLSAGGIAFDAVVASATAPTAFTIAVRYTPVPIVQTPTPSPLPTFTP